MPDLKIAVATNGDVPDNQCALKDAVLVAAAAGIQDPTEIVSIAQAFYAFLTNPGGATAAQAAQAVPTPAPEALGSSPLEIGNPDVQPSVSPDPAPADADPLVESVDAVAGEDSSTPAV